MEFFVNIKKVKNVVKWAWDGLWRDAAVQTSVQSPLLPHCGTRLNTPHHGYSK